jgi:hypothetical protein
MTILPVRFVLLLELQLMNRACAQISTFSLLCATIDGSFPIEVQYWPVSTDKYRDTGTRMVGGRVASEMPSIGIDFAGVFQEVRLESHQVHE